MALPASWECFELESNVAQSSCSWNILVSFPPQSISFPSFPLESSLPLLLGYPLQPALPKPQEGPQCSPVAVTSCQAQRSRAPADPELHPISHTQLCLSVRAKGHSGASHYLGAYQNTVLRVPALGHSMGLTGPGTTLCKTSQMQLKALTPGIDAAWPFPT